MTVSEVPDKYRLRMPVLDKSLLQVKKKKNSQIPISYYLKF